MESVLEQVPSDKMDDFVQGLVDLMEKKKARLKKKEEKESYRTDVLMDPPPILKD
tara:strand:+ start:146 stop:310 length:165 start_codon:yes stop_codon:yes gene_type:complete